MSTLALSFLIGSSSYLQVTRSAGNEDMYTSLNEFEIRQDVTTGFHGNNRVIMGKMLCPL